MKLARQLVLAFSAVSLLASPVLASAADASASAVSRQGAAMEEANALRGGGIFGGGTLILPLIALIAVALALTVSSGEQPVSP